MATTVNYSKILPAAAKAIGLAVVINIALFFLFFSIQWIDPHVGVGPSNEPVSIGATIGSTALSMVFATIIFILLMQYTKRPATIFTWVCSIALLLFLINPYLTIKGLPAIMGLALDVLHLAPAFLIWRFLTRTVK